MKTNGKFAALMAGVAIVGGALFAVPALAERGGMDGAMSGPFGGAMFDFATLDTDKDGKVTQTEIDAARQARIAALDANADGNITKDELVARSMADAQARADEMATRMIEMRDADGNGQLSAAELLVPAAPANMFERLDADGDGAITQAEMDAAKAQMQQRRGEGRMGKGEGHRGGHHRGGFGGFFQGDDGVAADPAAPVDPIAPAPVE